CRFRSVGGSSSVRNFSSLLGALHGHSPVILRLLTLSDRYTKSYFMRQTIDLVPTAGCRHRSNVTFAPNLSIVTYRNDEPHASRIFAPGGSAGLAAPHGSKALAGNCAFSSKSDPVASEYDFRHRRS
ncbi:hypothetical protein, partial [Mesorhizobium sp. M2E.F.Ca.ET.154.01.1.1]|uniref:hypothetical protein n=1 Tax=Mesorhizobium sp. M2E.F.Ca.ET.154.01.1.1 TaxID=2500521 RepID=UPI001AEDEBF1